MSGIVNVVGAKSGIIGTTAAYIRMRYVGGDGVVFQDNANTSLAINGASETPNYVEIDYHVGGYDGSPTNAGKRYHMTWTTDHYNEGITGWNSMETSADTTYFNTMVFTGFTSTGCTISRTNTGAAGSYSTLIVRFFVLL